MPALILVRGAGDLASGVALRLFRSGLNVAMTELAKPLAVRRSVSFAEAVYEGHIGIEDVMGRRANDPGDRPAILGIIEAREIPVIVDPVCVSAAELHPLVIVDGRMTKRPPERLSHEASMYIGLGPGFVALSNCHAVIETVRGHELGRVIHSGSAREDSGSPDGDPRRVLRTPVDGIFEAAATIGQHLDPGEILGRVADASITAPFPGVLRGLLRSGLAVHAGMKVGDLDPRDDPTLTRLVSDRALAVAGGVLEAVLSRADVRAKLWD